MAFPQAKGVGPLPAAIETDMSYGAHAEANLLPMTSQVGRYRVLDPLGQGATAMVYLAQDLTGRRVALKVLNPMAASQPHIRSCFQLEYRTMAQLRHPGILRVHDTGEANGRHAGKAEDIATGASHHRQGGPGQHVFLH